MPQQVVFMTREEQQRLIGLGIGIALLVALLALAVWVVTLKKHIRGRQHAEQARTEADLRLRLALSAAEMGTWHWDAPTGQSTRDASLNRMLGLDAVESTAARARISGPHPSRRSRRRDRGARSRREGAVAVRRRVPHHPARWHGAMVPRERPPVLQRVRRSGVCHRRRHGRDRRARDGRGAPPQRRALRQGLPDEPRLHRHYRAGPRRRRDQRSIRADHRLSAIAHPWPHRHRGRPGGRAAEVSRVHYAKIESDGSVRDFEYEMVSATGLRRTILASAREGRDGRPSARAVGPSRRHRAQARRGSPAPDRNALSRARRERQRHHLYGRSRRLLPVDESHRAADHGLCRQRRARREPAPAGRA